jgi:hypothetical protein
VTAPATTGTVTGLTAGTTYRIVVRAINAIGAGPFSASSNAVIPTGGVVGAGVPGAPTIGQAQQGARRGAVTAFANWTAPANVGGSAILSYTVSALLMAGDGVTVVGAPINNTAAANLRQLEVTLPNGTYRFEVVAVNAAGASPPSARSNTVVPR